MLREYIYNKKFQIYLINNNINILNYEEISSFDENKIVLKHSEGIVIINGKDLVISKLISDELLITGNITSIEFR